MNRKINIIPAIDIIQGKCVRLSQGDYAKQKTYNENPLEVAKSFEGNGIKHLHLVDLDGAKSAKVVNWKVLESIANNTNLKIDFGGGVKSDDDIRKVFESGANQITAGSIAVKSPDKVIEWITAYGAERIILGADVKNNKIAINGWKEESEVELFPFLKDFSKHGVDHVICTDISKDGMMAGSSIELYRKIMNQFPSLKLIASGGVSSIQEIHELQEFNLHGAIVGKAIYEGQISLKEIADFYK